VLAREPLLVLGDAHNLVKEFDDRVVFDRMRSINDASLRLHAVGVWTV